MESIKKIISLEDYKSRFKHFNAFFSKEKNDLENNWGKIPMDCYFSNSEIDCPFYDIKNNLPFTDGIIYNSNGNVSIIENVLRYKNLVYWYNWITNYGKKTLYYKLCRHNFDFIWVVVDGDFFTDDYNLDVKIGSTVKSVAYLPTDYENYAIGDIIEVNTDADLFNNIFRVKNKNKRYELLVLNFIKSFFNGEKNELAISIPYIDIPLHITQTFDSLGIFTNSAKEWDPYKKYIVGDVVLYKKEIYILENGDEYELMEITGGMYDVLYKKLEKFLTNTHEIDIYYSFKNGLPSENEEIIDIVYDRETKKRNIFYKKNGDEIQIFYPYLCHKAKLEIDKDEYFFDLSLWTKNIENEDENIETDYSGIILDGVFSGSSVENAYVENKVESKISTLKRLKKTIDDDGNTLPFIINQYGSINTELPFKMGRVNMNVGLNDEIYCDFMCNIIIYDENESLTLTYDFDKNEVFLTKNFTTKNIYDYEKTIYLNSNIALNNVESANTIFYKWEEVKKDNILNSEIEIVEYLPEPKMEYLNKQIQISSVTNNITIFTVYICKEEKIRLEYTGVSNTDITITPSLIGFSDEIFLKKDGNIIFNYIKDCFLDENNLFVPNTGLIYTDEYKYKLNTVALNYVSPESIEIMTPHSYKLHDYNIKDGDTILYDNNNIENGIFSYKNVGEIYANYDEYGKIKNYSRVLSEYKTIDINYENALVEVKSTEIENLTKLVTLSNVRYSLSQIMKDDFQKDYIYKNEFLMGIEDVIENYEVEIERGLSAAFEKHHILSEIKSLNDLENYRNNLFKL